MPVQTRGNKFKPLHSYSRADLMCYVSGPVQKLRRVQAPNGIFVAVTFCIMVGSKGLKATVEEIVQTIGGVIGTETFSRTPHEAGGSTFFIHHHLKGPRAESTGVPKLSYHTLTLFLRPEQFEPR